MHALTAEELTADPQRLIHDAHQGRCIVVSVEGEPTMFTVPLGPKSDTPAALLGLAVTLYATDHISLGRAAAVSGLSYSQMIDELGQRGIPVVRYSIEDLDRELEYVAALAEKR